MAKSSPNLTRWPCSASAVLASLPRCGDDSVNADVNDNMKFCVSSVKSAFARSAHRVSQRVILHHCRKVHKQRALHVANISCKMDGMKYGCAASRPMTRLLPCNSRPCRKPDVKPCLRTRDYREPQQSALPFSAVSRTSNMATRSLCGSSTDEAAACAT